MVGEVDTEAGDHSNSAVSLLANLHLAAARPNCDSVEYHMIHRQLFDAVPAGTFAMDDGYVRAPEIVERHTGYGMGRRRQRDTADAIAIAMACSISSGLTGSLLFARFGVIKWRAVRCCSRRLPQPRSLAPFSFQRFRNRLSVSHSLA